MGESPGRLQEFLGELKRRRVVRVATVYAAVAFVVIQVADLVFPTLMLPSWLNRAVIAFVVLGFPVALVLAWAFEVTPEGVRRTDEPAPASGPEAGAGAPTGPGTWLSSASAVAVGALVLVGVGLGWFLGGRGTDAAGARSAAGPASADGSGPGAGRGPLIHLSVSLPEGEALVERGSPVAVSPDGSLFAYAARRHDTARLYLRSLDRGTAEPLPGTEGARTPFFSPDGSWIGFFAGQRVMKISRQGGSPIEVAEFGSVGGAHWGENDTIYLGNRAAGPRRGLWGVPAAGGEPERLTTVEGFDLRLPEQGHVWPQLLPGGRAILYTSWNLPDDARVAVIDRTTGEQRILVEPGGQARYVPTGHIVYAWSGDLFAVPFDPETLTVTGSPVAILGGLSYRGSGGAGFALSETGTLLRVPGEGESIGSTLAWVDLEGRTEELPYPPGSYASPRVSPDGSRIVVQKYEDRARVWLLDPVRGMARRLTSEEPMEFWPIWDTGSHSVVHNSNRFGGPGLNLYRTPVDGSRPPKRLTQGEYTQQPQSWTPDGRTLIYTQLDGFDAESSWDIWALDAEGDREPRPVLRTPEDEFHPALSPDGRWLAYASDRSGESEVYVQRYPGPGGLEQVSSAGGVEPLWSPDGRRLYYRSPGGDTVWSAAFSGGDEPQIGRSEVLLTGSFSYCCRPGRSYDLAPDGRQFLMILEGESPPPPRRIDVIMNWFGELERLAGT